MNNEYPSLIKLAVFFCILAVILLLVACTNQYDQCIEQQRAEYRQRNPNASYGQVLGRQREFELMCSKFKAQ